MGIKNMSDRNNGLYDREQIKKTIQTVFVPGQVFEVRIIQNSRKGGISGYFKSADDLLKALNTVDLRDANVYMTINTLDDACYDMVQRNRFVAGAQTTSDNDVVGYSWLFVDLDPKRKPGVSSTDSEREAAFALAKKVTDYLSVHGFTEPIKAVSGNGAHLLYPISLANTEENKLLIQGCLQALDYMFSNDKVDIDISTFNPARICKLYGTMAQKGTANSENRPHRMSYIFRVPTEINSTPKTNLEWLANQRPVMEEQSRPQYGYQERNDFEIERWLTDHNIAYKVTKHRDGTKYVLNECPFNRDHKAPDSAVFKSANGAIGFKCFHNSCQGKTWRDVRVLFEPNAYTNAERNDIEIGAKHYVSNKQRQTANDSPYSLDIANPDPNEKPFRNMPEIVRIDEPENEYLLTGINQIDDRMNGLAKGAVSVLSGLRGAAKSTLLSQIMLSVIDKGNTVVCYSGELSNKNFAKWMLLQAAGRRYIDVTGKFKNHSVIKDKEIEFRIAEWMGDRFWLFNNNYGNKFSMLADLLQKQAEKVHADFVVIDNLMAVDLDTSSDKYDAQTQFVWKLKDIAKQCNVHVCFVAHPRKSVKFLRLNDISGSGNISNIVDVGMIIHRCNHDFNEEITEYLGGEKEKRKIIPDSCTNVIEICKDRENGTQDVFIPLWYESASKRLFSREPDQSYDFHFGWEYYNPSATNEQDDDEPY